MNSTVQRTPSKVGSHSFSMIFLVFSGRGKGRGDVRVVLGNGSGRLGWLLLLATLYNGLRSKFRWLISLVGGFMRCRREEKKHKNKNSNNFKMNLLNKFYFKMNFY